MLFWLLQKPAKLQKNPKTFIFGAIPRFKDETHFQTIQKIHPLRRKNVLQKKFWREVSLSEDFFAQMDSLCLFCLEVKSEVCKRPTK